MGLFGDFMFTRYELISEGLRVNPIWGVLFSSLFRVEVLTSKLFKFLRVRFNPIEIRYSGSITHLRVHASGVSC